MNKRFCVLYSAFKLCFIIRVVDSERFVRCAEAEWTARCAAAVCVEEKDFHACMLVRLMSVGVCVLVCVNICECVSVSLRDMFWCWFAMLWPQVKLQC